MWPFFAIFIFSVIIGSAFIIVAYIVGSASTKSADNSSEQNALNSSSIEERLAKSVEDADSALEQLSGMSSLIFEELEGKYKELLFLYQLIDEKKIEVSNIYTKNLELVNSFNTYTADISPSNSVQSNNSFDIPVELNEHNNDPSSLTERDQILNSEGITDNSIQSRYAEVFSLFNEGNSISDIAKTLDIGQGEVKLIIELGRIKDKDLGVLH